MTTEKSVKSAEETKAVRVKKNTWIFPRHRWIRYALEPFVTAYTAWKYGITVEPFKEQGDRQYLVIMNHQTAFDQFFVEMAFDGPIYYIATEDIFSIGWISSVIRYLVAPIPIRKQTVDLQAVRNCFVVAKEGGTICLAPEGNRTYSGKTEYMNPAIVKLLKKLKLPLAIFRIEGGYGVQPRWSDVVRKGKMRAYVSKVIEPEEYRNMSDEELLAVIQEGIAVNEASVDGLFTHSKSAEYLERAMYVCPFCGLAEFESNGQFIHCKKCGRKIQYMPTKEMEGVGFHFPFRFVNDWYMWQCDYVNKLQLLECREELFFEDTASMSEVIVYQRKQPICKKVQLSLYGGRILVRTENGGEFDFSFDEISAVTVLGKNKMNIYAGEKIYQFKGSARFNALKYVNFYHRYKNIMTGDENGQFLGL